jgi:hypothetical protein
MTEAKKVKVQTREWKDWQPKDFKPTHCTDIIRMMSKGGGPQTFCAQYNLSRALFYQWLTNYPDFKLSYEIAKLHCDQFLLKQLQDYCVEVDKDGIETLNIQIWKEQKKMVREVQERKEAVMQVNLEGDTKTMMTSVLNALGAGLIELEDATALANLIELNQRVGENSELMAKIEALELALKSGSSDHEFKEES